MLPTNTTCTAANVDEAVKQSTRLYFVTTAKTVENSKVKATMLPSRARGERIKYKAKIVIVERREENIVVKMLIVVWIVLSR